MSLSQKVRRIHHVQEKEMLAAAEALRTQVKAGEVRALGLMVELVGREVPVTVILGQYSRDPYRALVALERVRGKLVRAVDRRAAEEEGAGFQESLK